MCIYIYIFPPPPQSLPIPMHVSTGTLGLQSFARHLVPKTIGNIKAMMDSSSKAADRGIHQSTTAKIKPDSAMILSHLALVGSVTKSIIEAAIVFFATAGDIVYFILKFRVVEAHV